MIQAEMQPNVLLITPGQSYRLAAYLRATQSVGVTLQVVSDSQHSLTLEIAEGLQVDFNHPAEAVNHVRAHTKHLSINGIVATDDNCVELAAGIGEALGLSVNSAEAARLSRRKDLARQRLQSAGVAVPEHWLLDLTTELPPQLSRLPYPLVLKPVSLSASRGVIRADTPDQALDACRQITKIIAPLASAEERNTILAERYLPGEEVALEAFIHEGTFYPLAIFDKPDPLTGPCFEESYYITPSRHPLPVQQQIQKTVQQACRAYGLQQGPIHAEVRVSQGRAWILEVASRTIGGECSQILDEVLVQPLEQLVLSAAIGSPVNFQKRPGAAGVLMIPTPQTGVLRRINGEQRVRSVKHIREIRLEAEPGQVLQTLPEGGDYLGFIYSSAKTPHEAEQALRLAHAQLEITIDPLLL
ncbi:MAG: ATP-grasp domain-containing protein [Chromatiales bacterium]|nr:ATP-grasp domain-containing protein [Chromatiales bacterium]